MISSSHQQPDLHHPSNQNVHLHNVQLQNIQHHQASISNMNLSSHSDQLHNPNLRLNQSSYQHYNQNPNQSHPMNMVNIQSHQINQMHHSQPSFSPNAGNFSPKNLTPDDLIIFKPPSNATNSIYVDGIPIDSTEREVAHVFRPFPGFQEVRLIKKETKSGRQFYFCFVDFENSYQSTIAINTLQGYRFDKNDSKGLKISYAFHAPDTIKKSSNSSQTPTIVKKLKIKKK